MASWWLRQSGDWPTILFANAILIHQLLGGGMEVNEGGVCVMEVDEGGFWMFGGRLRWLLSGVGR